MFEEYWWVFIIIIFLIMIFYPRRVPKVKNPNKEAFKPNLSLKPVLTNLNTLTSYYVGLH